MKRLAKMAIVPLRELGEDRLVARLIRQLPTTSDVVVGAGDDCAVVRPPRGNRRLQLLKTDVVVEGVHFLSSHPPAAVGWKAAARAVSDVAAMGGWPTHGVVTVIAPPDTAVAWLEASYRGLARCARQFGFSLAGGETSGTAHGTPISLNVSLLGEVEADHCVLRSGARPGDALLVTGRLGGSLRTGRHLRVQPRVSEARWLVQHHRPSAMMDLSDGLGKDLPRLATASGIGWRIDVSQVPRHRGCSVAEALGDGEDFELFFAHPQHRLSRLMDQWPRVFPRLPLSVIGEATAAGSCDPPLQGGFDHFQASSSSFGPPLNNGKSR